MPPQDCDLGFASAVAAAQLEPARLLARLDGLADGVRGVRGALAGRTVPADVGSGGALATTTFAPLPLALALWIFSILPIDQRARAALVCRAWRDALADAGAWTCLDLSNYCGISVAVTDAVLRAAAARANGRLIRLHYDDFDAITPAALLEVVTANAGTLRYILAEYHNVDAYMDYTDVEALVRAAPHLKKIWVDGHMNLEQATAALRSDAPFGVLYLRALKVDAPEDDADAAAVLEFATALQNYKLHEWLVMVALHGLPLHNAAALDAVCTALIALQLKSVVLENCRLGPASVPALVRLFNSGGVRNLFISNDDTQLLDEATAVQLADALSTSQLLSLQLDCIDLWSNMAAATTVLRALTGHPTLEELRLFSNVATDAVAAGLALGALVEANAPSLSDLEIAASFLGDAGLAPIMEALPHNTHLRDLNCNNCHMSHDFAREHFLPAVRANTSLRYLKAAEWWGNIEDGVAPPEVLEAEALMAARAAADAA